VFLNKYWSSAAAALAIAATPAPAQQNSLAADAAAFGAREAAENMDLSPDGTHVVYVGPGPNRVSVVLVADLTTGEAKPVLKSSADPEIFSWCAFASNMRLACRYYGATMDADHILGFGRLISLGIDGSNVKPLGQSASAYDARARQFDGSIIDWLPGEGNSVLMTRDFIPEEGKMDTNIIRNADGLGVVKIDVATLKTETVERPSRTIGDFMSDGNGHVRIMEIPEVTRDGSLTGRIRYQYRTANSRDWQILVDYQKDDFYPLAIDSTIDSLYALKKLDGRFALFRVKLDNSLNAELVASNPKVDIDNVVRIGDGQRVIGYTYVEDERRTVYFDPEYDRLAKSLSKVLPKLPLVQFVTASADGNKILLFAGSDSDPGHYYLFNKASKSLGEVMAARTELAGRTLASVKTVSYPAADGTQIPAYLTLPPGSTGKGLPAVVLPHGGPSARDEWGFDWLAQFLAARGYAVIQPNYRGSAGFGDAWLGDKGFKAWRTSIGDVSSAARWLASEGIADPKRLAIVGWSYGGYAALQSAVTEPALYKAVVAIAPITDLGKLKRDADYYVNDRIVADLVGSGPHVEEGSPLRHADAFTAPVLLVHGAMDNQAFVDHSRDMAAALRKAGKPVDYLEFKGLYHNLADSTARTEMLMRIGALLDRTIGH
jgi:dipeptidyl aminopeptidase/acylaminoacyl peptidase